MRVRRPEKARRSGSGTPATSRSFPSSRGVWTVPRARAVSVSRMAEYSAPAAAAAW